MADDNHSRWHVRIDGETFGPLSSAELRDLAGRGGISPATPVSKDGVRWVPAGKVRGLPFRDAVPGMAVVAPAADPACPPALPAPITAGTVALVAVLTALTVSILGCGLFGLLIPPENSPVVAAAAAVPIEPAPAASAGPTPEQLRSERTLAYWEGMRQSLLSETKVEPAAARRIAVRLRALPASGVDPDAIECCLALAGLLEDASALRGRLVGGEFFTEAIVRAANGDPWGASADFLADDKELRRRVEAVQRQIGDTRVVLSSRHGVEFPAF